MIERNLQRKLLELAGRHPVVTLIGPRQSGKTTLCRMAFPEMPYLSLENKDTRRFATIDPRGFLAQYRQGAILDEIQRAPDLPSYLQQVVDEDLRPGRFILTGSQNFVAMELVSQSLAGRSALLTLLPLSLDEVDRFGISSETLFSRLWRGGFPAIFDRSLPPGEWLDSYVSLYVERDVRQVLRVGDLTTFETFLRLLAGRCGQLLNLSGLGADSGISHVTARAWLSVLETGFVCFRLPPYTANWRKQLVKTRKVYFFDTGLLCRLLDIHRPEQLVTHPLRGAVFENWVVSEVYKAFVHRGEKPRLAFYRDKKGVEVDLLIRHADALTAVEIKSGQTIHESFARSLKRFTRISREQGGPVPTGRFVVHGGDELQIRTDVTYLPATAVQSVDWTLPP